jgi:hypothetical protein
MYQIGVLQILTKVVVYKVTKFCLAQNKNGPVIPVCRAVLSLDGISHIQKCVLQYFSHYI